MYRCLTVTVSIQRLPAQVYAFVSNGDNLARWLTFCTSVRRSRGEWVLDTPVGEMRFRFVPANELGVLDHHVELPDGQEVLNPMRVVPNGPGSEVIFTLFQRPGMSDEEFARDARTVETDLRQLKSVLEA
jgi:hypothetical protein